MTKGKMAQVFDFKKSLEIEEIKEVGLDKTDSNNVPTDVQMAQVGTAEGNSISSALVSSLIKLCLAEIQVTGDRKRVNPANRWCFTLNNWTVDQLAQVISVLDTMGALYVIGKEIAPTTKTIHLQGYVHFKDRVRPAETIGVREIHWIKASCKPSVNKNEEANIIYCTKEGDYILKGLEIPETIEILKESQLFDWQKRVIELIQTKPDDRSIWWYYDEHGKGGKSKFCKYLAVKYGCGLVSSGKAGDVKFYYQKRDCKVYLVDVPRTVDEGQAVSYQALEEIKNGTPFCTKFKCETPIRNSPHVIVFSNELPDYKKFSPDKWRIRKIPNRQTVTYENIDICDA